MQSNPVENIQLYNKSLFDNESELGITFTTNSESHNYSIKYNSITGEINEKSISRLFKPESEPLQKLPNNYYVNVLKQLLAEIALQEEYIQSINTYVESKKHSEAEIDKIDFFNEKNRKLQDLIPRNRANSLEQQPLKRLSQDIGESFGSELNKLSSQDIRAEKIFNNSSSEFVVEPQDEGYEQEKVDFFAQLAMEAEPKSEMHMELESSATAAEIIMHSIDLINTGKDTSNTHGHSKNSSYLKKLVAILQSQPKIYEAIEIKQGQTLNPATITTKVLMGHISKVYKIISDEELPPEIERRITTAIKQRNSARDICRKIKDSTDITFIRNTLAQLKIIECGVYKMKRFPQIKDFEDKIAQLAEIAEISDVQPIPAIIEADKPQKQELALVVLKGIEKILLQKDKSALAKIKEIVADLKSDKVGLLTLASELNVFTVSIDQVLDNIALLTMFAKKSFRQEGIEKIKELLLKRNFILNKILDDIVIALKTNDIKLLVDILKQEEVIEFFGVVPLTQDVTVANVSEIHLKNKINQLVSVYKNYYNHDNIELKDEIKTDQNIAMNIANVINIRNARIKLLEEINNLRLDDLPLIEDLKVKFQDDEVMENVGLSSLLNASLQDLEEQIILLATAVDVDSSSVTQRIQTIKVQQRDAADLIAEQITLFLDNEISLLELVVYFKDAQIQYIRVKPLALDFNLNNLDDAATQLKDMIDQIVAAIRNIEKDPIHNKIDVAIDQIKVARLELLSEIQSIKIPEDDASKNPAAIESLRNIFQNKEKMEAVGLEVLGEDASVENLQKIVSVIASEDDQSIKDQLSLIKDVDAKKEEVDSHKKDDEQKALGGSELRIADVGPNNLAKVDIEKALTDLYRANIVRLKRFVPTQENLRPLRDALVKQFKAHGCQKEIAIGYADAVLKEDFTIKQRDVWQKLFAFLGGVGLILSLSTAIQVFVGSTAILAPIAPVITALTTSIAVITSPALVGPICIFLTVLCGAIAAYSLLTEPQQVNLKKTLQNLNNKIEAEMSKHNKQEALVQSHQIPNRQQPIQYEMLPSFSEDNINNNQQSKKSFVAQVSMKEKKEMEI